MDSDNNLQDVIRCHFCEIPAPQLHCDTCHTNLCKVCAGEHHMDETKIHIVLPIKKRSYTPTYPTCPKHITKQCKLHCEQCDKAIYKQHKAVDIMETFQHKKEIIDKDLKELEMSIFRIIKDMRQFYQLREPTCKKNVRNGKDITSNRKKTVMQKLSKQSAEKSLKSAVYYPNINLSWTIWNKNFNTKFLKSHILFII